MTLENTVQFYASKETPDEIIIDGQALIPIRTIMRLYEPSFRHGAQWRYSADDIKDLCRRFKIPVIKPYGVYNIPCINKKFLNGICYLFRNNHYRYGCLINITSEVMNEILSDVQSILRIIEDEIEQYHSNCNHTNDYEYEDECYDYEYEYDEHEEYGRCLE
jgi:hypothetical protein